MSQSRNQCDTSGSESSAQMIKLWDVPDGVTLHNQHCEDLRSYTHVSILLFRLWGPQVVHPCQHPFISIVRTSGPIPNQHSFIYVVRISGPTPMSASFCLRREDLRSYTRLHPFVYVVRTSGPIHMSASFYLRCENLWPYTHVSILSFTLWGPPVLNLCQHPFISIVRTSGPIPNEHSFIYVVRISGPTPMSASLYLRCENLRSYTHVCIHFI
jgi:hypothetical protein